MRGLWCPRGGSCAAPLELPEPAGPVPALPLSLRAVAPAVPVKPPRTHGPQRQAAARRDAVSVPPAAGPPRRPVPCPLSLAEGWLVLLCRPGGSCAWFGAPRPALRRSPLTRLLRQLALPPGRAN